MQLLQEGGHLGSKVLVIYEWDEADGDMARVLPRP